MHFQIGYNELAFYNNHGNFVVESGEFVIFVGTDSYTDNHIKVVVED